MNAVSDQVVSGLKEHPALRGMWALPDDHGDFLVLVESIREVGVVEALKVTSAGLVVDGRHRLRVARRLRLETVPCIVVPDHAVAEIALNTLCGRRHLLGKGQVAYAGYPLFKEAHRAAIARHQEAGGSGQFSSSHDGQTIEAFAERLGVSRDLFLQASKLHALFTGDPGLRTEWEPRIMDSTDPLGLGSAIAGIAGARSTRGKDRGPTRNSALSRWCASWKELGRHSRAWDRWSPEDRDTAHSALRDSIAILPEPLLDSVRDALRAARRARQDEPGEA